MSTILEALRKSEAERATPPAGASMAPAPAAARRRWLPVAAGLVLLAVAGWFAPGLWRSAGDTTIEGAAERAPAAGAAAGPAAEPPPGPQADRGPGDPATTARGAEPTGAAAPGRGAAASPPGEAAAGPAPQVRGSLSRTLPTALGGEQPRAGVPEERMDPALLGPTSLATPDAAAQFRAELAAGLAAAGLELEQAAAGEQPEETGGEGVEEAAGGAAAGRPRGAARTDPRTAARRRDGASALPSVYRMAAGPARSVLEALTLNMHVYAADPARRFVLIDLRRREEGFELGAGLRIARIAPEGVVLEDQDGDRWLWTPR